MSTKWVLCVLLVAQYLTSGCGNTPIGDCDARIRYDDTTYHDHSGSAARGKFLGAADRLGCDRASLDQVDVYAVKGVDPAVAVIIKMEADSQRPIFVVHIAEDVPQSSWPEAPRQRVS